MKQKAFLSQFTESERCTRWPSEYNRRCDQVEKGNQIKWNKTNHPLVKVQPKGIRTVGDKILPYGISPGIKLCYCYQPGADYFPVMARPSESYFPYSPSSAITGIW